MDLFLKGSTGSGFVVNDARGNLYVVTNNHVIEQAHTLSITFERQDGYKKKFENLKIIAADEAADLALLAFAPGDKPVERGLSFLNRAVAEGEDVYSAGFPGLGTTSLWQFGKGMVSNGNARFPRSLDDDTMMGPFIQHTAQVDPGNSGGPLLIPQRSVPGGYAVAGINTLSALWRQAANYAIPVNRAQPFINGALVSRPETYRAALDERLDTFVKGLGGNRAVYPHIAGYLSSACVGENAEFAMTEMFRSATMTTLESFIDRARSNVVGAMGYAVAWTIENSIRGQGAIKAAVKDVSGSGEEYTVIFIVNNKDFNSTWIREYGNWRIRNFGEAASGGKDRLTTKQQAKKDKETLRTDSDFNMEAGYAYLFKKGHAGYASINYMNMVGLRTYIAGADFFSIGLFAQYQKAIRIKEAVAIMPFINGGLEYHHDQSFEDWKEADFMSLGFPLAIAAQAGVKVTTAKVPGLYAGAGFQYNICLNKNPDRMNMALAVMAGYSF